MNKTKQSKQRLAFYVDVGDLTGAAALSFVNKVKAAYHQREHGTNFWIPVKNGVPSVKIEVIE